MKLARAVAIFAAVMWLIAGCVIAHAETHICRGPVTHNTGEPPYDSSRLIMAEHITESCLFDASSAIGKEILSVCAMGDTCIVKARVRSTWTDVYVIKYVLSVTR